MLIQLKEPAEAVARLAGSDTRWFAFRNFCRRHDAEPEINVLADDPADPHVLVAYAGTGFMFCGEIRAFGPMMIDLLNGDVDVDGGWQSERLEINWGEHGQGGHGIFLNTAPYAVWRAGVLAGFEPNPDDSAGQVAYQWNWTGEPRFSHLVRHPCRVVHGLELFELMKRAVHYDPEGKYIRQCLENGPSFVCEVDGEPKCWSCVHLNGTMGMIFTPDELRRHGYARSLGAFQLDYMLEHYGFAACHIIDFNTPSMNLVASLGAEITPEPVVWRVLWWPGERPVREREPTAEQDQE